MNTQVTLCGLQLDNPVMAASGCFGYGEEMAGLYDINCLGSFSFKGTTLHPRFGNPTPRIAETASGMLNAVGLQNPGVHKVIEVELPKMKQFFHKPVMANVSGFSIAEYVDTCRLLDQQEQVGWLEVNISCPNVHEGGMSFGTDARSAARVTAAVKAVCSKPVLIKLSPNVTDIAEIALACEAEGADGFSLINTFMGMRLDLNTRRPVLANVTGGLSGPAIFPLALHLVHKVHCAVKVPVIGMGGISSAEDVLEMMLAGATAVQVGAASLVDPFVLPQIVKDLPRAMARYGIQDIKDVIGGMLT